MTSSTVEVAISCWWTAMADRDLETLGAIVDEECTFLGGPGGRESGRHEFLANAKAFFADGEIRDWDIDRLQVVLHGETAIATYAWSEKGTHGDAPFALDGIATDVYRHADDAWLMVARHVGTGKL